MRLLLSSVAAVVLVNAGQFRDDAKHLAGIREATTPVELQVSSTKTLGVPLFPAYGFTLADKDGDLFFHLGGGSFANGTIMKLSHSSYEPTLYNLPPEIQKSYNFYQFAVSPDGTLWMLVNAGPELMAASFDSDGELRGKATLKVSLDEFNIKDFAALPNGTLFIAGLGLGKDKGHSIAAFFNGDTGEEIKRLDTALAPENTPKSGPAIHQGDACVGDDGNLYLLHDTHILVINPAGTVVRRTTFDKPLSTLLPVHMIVSSGFAAIWLNTPPNDSHHFETSYLVVDVNNRNPATWYSAPSGVRIAAVDFSRNDGFQFLVGEKGQYRLMTAELR